MSDRELLQQAHDLILSYSETRDAALTQDRHTAEAWLVSYAASLVPCEAVVWHGPGHQSKTACELRGPHTEHYAHILGSETDWTCMIGSLDYNGYTVHERVYCDQGDGCHVLREPGDLRLCPGYMHPRNR